MADTQLFKPGTYMTLRKIRKPETLVGPGKALVLLRAGQPRVALWPGQDLTSGERLFGGYRQACAVDLTEQTLDFSSALPACEEPFRFNVTVHVRYRVHDPVQVVRAGLADPGPALRQYLMTQLRAVSARFSVADRAEAEAELVRTVQGKRHAGIVLTEVSLELEPSEEAAAHLRRLARARRDGRVAPA